MKRQVWTLVRSAVAHPYDWWRVGQAYSRLKRRSDRDLADMGLTRDGLKAQLWADVRRRRDHEHAAARQLHLPTLGSPEELELRATNESRPFARRKGHR